MLKDSHECAPPLPEFLLEAQALLAKSEDCLSHLHLIRNDEEAINCLLASLQSLAQIAARHAISPLAEFALHIHGVLKRTVHPVDLNDPILDALRSCLTLMAWQLELVDPHNGQLNLDDSEQLMLIGELTQQVTQNCTCASPSCSH
ncbi:uncharacterized protein POS17_4292 [Pseudomonas sp. Os17]|uniref:Uncharacterized protein n=1 Tax=Pseudomonas protegens TaxID=380021 RepID=A0A2T6GDB1_9PSED|nr:MULTISPECIES: hypothetical protein [Pseudomonas]PUA42144.1 hypothetical protein C5U62_27125 [Pseudomonas protegens]RXU63529.1 hypothetical protein CW358_20120 [Pseudomonas protegens]ULT72607.1 hypothetical protein L1O02_09690 [Pseudomonas sp. BC42]BAQ75986.1 uncharacterized protein POS17_4292 [Pseudomonas sp. Os17]